MIEREYNGISTYFNDIKTFNHYFIIAPSGSGKSVAVESLIDGFIAQGGKVFYITDVKNNFEGAFAMFKPRKREHLKILELIGAEPTSHNVIIHHPFSFTIPNKKLPEINFFTIPLKSLGRNELAMILQSDDSALINVSLEIIDKLNKNETLLHFLHHLMERVTKNKGKPREETFFLNTTTGTAKDLNRATSYFTPLLRKYPFITEETNKFNIDFKKIMKDNNDFHFLSTRWIDDDKIKYFSQLLFFKGIIDNLEYTKRPILIVLEEIGNFVPKVRNAKSYQTYLARAISDALQIMRSKGANVCSSIMTTQIESTPDQEVKNKATKILIGKITDSEERRRTAKNNNLGTGDMEILDGLKIGEFVDKDDVSRVMKVIMPRFMHKEQEYEFIKMYREHYKDKMKEYKGIISYMKEIQNNVLKEIKEKALLKWEREQEKKKKKSKSKEPQTITKVIKDNSELAKIWKQMKDEGKSLSQIAKEFNVLLSNGKPHKAKIKRAIDKLIKEEQK